MALAKIAGRNGFRPLPKKIFESYYSPIQVSDMTREELTEKIAIQRGKIIVIKKRLEDLKKKHGKVAKEARRTFRKARMEYKKFTAQPIEKKPPIEIIKMRSYLRQVDDIQKSRLSKIYIELNDTMKKMRRIEHEIDKMTEELLRRSV